jgi:hypothetical protein
VAENWCIIRDVRIHQLNHLSPAAILLAGGDKTVDERWYEVNVPLAEFVLIIS